MNVEKILKQVINHKGSAFFYTPPIYRNSKSFFFKKPLKTINSNSVKSFDKKLSEFEKSISGRTSGYCLINYEAGYSLEKRLHNLLDKEVELFKGFVFKNTEISEFKSSSVIFDKIRSDFNISNFRLNTTKRKYKKAIKEIKKHISEGDTYQVNFTVKGKFKLEGDIISFFKSLVFNQSAKYTAFISTGDKIIISISPELFFEQNERKILTRPMKGTISRGINQINDLQKKKELQNSKKNLAENVMIVDLLRNDFGRICEFGTVKTEQLFDIEKYESLYQMISTVKGNLRKEIKLPEIIKNIFPCGSITGAPKIRTMEIINELETGKRGTYTGGVGIVTKDKTVFNVAIRTIEISKSGNGEIGLGSGIVWDSDPEEEYEETILKSRFLTEPLKEFQLFETMRFEKGRIKNLDEHLNRLKESADHFRFNFNSKSVLKKITKQISKLIPEEKKRIKVTLNKQGKANIEIFEYPVIPSKVKIAVSNKRISSTNKFQYFKTTNRQLYRAERTKYSKKGCFDVIFLNERGEIAEGGITNIFIRKGRNWLTPPILSGVLNGIERESFINVHKNVKEKEIYLRDLKSADEIILTNSLRGSIRVDSIIS
ncbi:MAG TPA: aminodeoxychorismate synthase component I [Ignavibacteriaceae bacterium]|nr:aminodeoxychorismate synthase component I [Ignavibacteriaceae bacterium]